MFNITPNWKSTFPNAHAGILVMRNISNLSHPHGIQIPCYTYEAD